MKLFTIGYEQATQPEVVATLKAAGVSVLADARALASSRRAGFSKTLLAGALNEAAIEYVHLRGVGTPKAGRDAARAGRIGEMRQIYEGHMAEPSFQLDYERLRAIAADRPTAILCLCGEASKCHRGILSERLAEDDGFEVVDL